MMESSQPWIISGMGTKNQQFETPFKQFLDVVIANPPQHARFLNMLSLMEHIGSRKIMLSQMRGTLPTETLKHLAEEARHAHFFKREASKLAGDESADYTPANTMARGAAVMYFGKLDAALNEHIGTNDNDTCYLWVSLIVELRACWAYHFYQEALQSVGARLSLRSLMAEETLHLQEMFEAVCQKTAEANMMIEKFCTIETALFAKFWQQLSGEILSSKAA